MPVTVNGNAIIPAPFARVSSEPVLRDDGVLINRVTTVTLSGKLVAHRGSPNSSGVFWTASGYPPDETIAADSRMRSMLRKQEAIEALFREGGLTVELQSPDGSAPRKFYPRAARVEFSEGPWVEVCDYTITLEDDTDDSVSRVSEDWSLESLDEARGTYRLTRTLSATSRVAFDENGDVVNDAAWRTSREYVLEALGLGIKAERMEAPGVIDGDALQAFNYLRSESVGELSGSYAVTESWLCFDPGSEPPALHEATVSTRRGNDGLSTVSVEGNITGLEVRNTSTRALISSRWTNAQRMWNEVVQPNLLDTARGLSGITVREEPLSTQTGVNPAQGTFSYSYEYEDKEDLGEGILSREVTVTNHDAADVFAAIPVPGRAGPVLQDPEATTAKRRTVQVEIQKKRKTSTYTPTEPNTDAQVDPHTPTSDEAVFLEEDNTSWSEDSGRYSRTVSWTYN